ncbi:tyrosine--tRNA ligase [Candidatus Micrarchaeota archaeon CG10_big_fil_rev_8_21_14_0_10_54_18]|nr:MAG: tyrosine--tRNA ligase [Candidatus Micrarchaeota archaeon CG10_big_fil_rev_8_21_14_0_10_54_18]
MTMNLEERFQLVSEVGEEIIEPNELRALLEEKKHPVAYDGFEPSGRIHIAQGLLRSINVNKLTKAGIKFKFWVADWFALMNNKLDGDLDKIHTTGEYFVETWKAAGMDLKNVEFLWASENMGQEYWLRTIRIARLNTVARVTRCAQIMGRSEKDVLSAAQIFYPCMQASDIFQLGVDIAQLGMDQRKVNVLAREVAPKLGYKKPIAVHHHMLAGLAHPKDADAGGIERSIQFKMSKSDPDSAIFMTDSEEEVERKLGKAYCPEGVAENNPVLEYAKYVVFEKFESPLKIERPAKFGGDLEFKSYGALEKAFLSKELHPADLKKGVAAGVNELIEPVRKHFEKGRARGLLEEIESFKVTK